MSTAATSMSQRMFVFLPFAVPARNRALTFAEQRYHLVTIGYNGSTPQQELTGNA